MTARLAFWIGLKALVMMGIIVYAGIGLGPDEAQYWTWSQALDWGYYSKPPGIAWQIWTGTQLLGQTEWGVRAGAVLLAMLQAWLVYLLALRAELKPYTALWCGLLMAFCPLGILGSLFAITDGGLLFCWTGACLTMVTALQQKQAPDSMKVSLWILCGALFKWPIYLFWMFFLLMNYWFFPTQKKSRLLAGILVSLLGLLPSVWWNWSHDWATFRHVFSTLQGGSGQRASGNVGDFLGAQALLLSPVLFGLMGVGFWKWIQQRRQLPPALFFCGFVTLTLLCGAAFVSCFQKVQGNWVVFVYPTGIIILGWTTFEYLPRLAIWTKLGLGLSVILVSFFLLFSSSVLPYRLNPLKHNVGWTALGSALQKVGYDPKEHFLVSDKYQTTSILSFYGEGQKRAYFLNLQGMRRNQFSYWPSLQEEQKNKTGYFVWTENMPHLKREWPTKRDFYQQTLERYFEKVKFVDLIPLVYEGTTIAKAAIIFQCENCQDSEPLNSNLY